MPHWVVLPVAFSITTAVGRWEKPHPTQPLKLYADNGEEMKLNRGKTYLALVDDDEWSNFNYQ